MVMTGARIMVVEDDGIIALYLETQLIDLGYTVSGAAATGDEAVPWNRSPLTWRWKGTWRC
jgi:CheY-like chemotaxis protein